MTPRIIGTLGKVWLYGASFVISLSYGWIWYQHGFGALRELVSPFNFWNYGSVIITLAPGFLLGKLAGEIEKGQNRKALWSLGGVLLSVVAVAFFFALVFMNNGDNKNNSGNDQVRKSETTSIRVKGKSATMYQHKNYLVTLASGPVGSEGIPEIIRVGDVVTVKDSTIRVEHIVVTEFLKDMKYGKDVLGQKGDIQCTIVQSLDNLPYVDEHDQRDRLWINVKDCEPLEEKGQ